jgi:hypothetical protein
MNNIAALLKAIESSEKDKLDSNVSRGEDMHEYIMDMLKEKVDGEFPMIGEEEQEILRYIKRQRPMNNLDLRQNVMDLLKGRIKMGAGIETESPRRKKRKAAPKKKPAKKRPHRKDVNIHKLNPARSKSVRKNQMTKEMKKLGEIEVSKQLKQRLMKLLGGMCCEDCDACDMGGGVQIAGGMKKCPKGSRKMCVPKSDMKKVRGRERESKGTETWNSFVKKFAKKNKVDYKTALKKAGPSWKRYKREHGM